MNQFLYFAYYLSDYFFLDDFLNELRNLDHFFDHSRHYNYLLNYLLDLDYFWYFYHLLYDFLDEDWNLFDPIDNSRNFHYSFLDLLDYLGYFDININKFLNFYYLRFSYDKRLFKDNFLNVHRLYPWNNGFFND